MLYFKNHELAETYHISDRTVRNWIEETKSGKLALALHTHDGKAYVANTAKNLATIEGLVAARKKYRPHRTFKVIAPDPEFYRLFSPGQVYDIVSNLEIHHEIPRQYNYFDGGADSWDVYATRLDKEQTPNVLNKTKELLTQNQGYIDNLLRKYTRINVVDIGVGNSMPVKELIERLNERQAMGRYIALDISQNMLNIAKRNIQKWFGNTVLFEGYELDINYDRFGNILAEEYLRKDADQTANLILLLGGMLGNLRHPDGALRIIHDSMGINDQLVYIKKLDTKTARRHFDFNVEPGGGAVPPVHSLVVDLLNIDRSFYELEVGYEQELRQRYERIRFKIALTLKFQLDEGGRSVSFNKGDSILLWRSQQQSALEVINQFDRNDFYMLHSSQTDDQDYLLTISRVKTAEF